MQACFTGDGAKMVAVRDGRYDETNWAQVVAANAYAMADAMIPKPKKPENAQPGKSESRRLNDGTERVFNPNYPGPMKNPRGRPTGWRKPKPEIVPAVPTEPFAEPTIPMFSTKEETPPESVMAAVIDPDFATKEEAKAAIHALSGVMGLEVAKAALAKFRATHLNDVAVCDYKALVLHCEELKNVPAQN